MKSVSGLLFVFVVAAMLTLGCALAENPTAQKTGQNSGQAKPVNKVDATTLENVKTSGLDMSKTMPGVWVSWEGETKRPGYILFTSSTAKGSDKSYLFATFLSATKEAQPVYGYWTSTKENLVISESPKISDESAGLHIESAKARDGGQIMELRFQPPTGQKVGLRFTRVTDQTTIRTLEEAMKANPPSEKKGG